MFLKLVVLFGGLLSNRGFMPKKYWIITYLTVYPAYRAGDHHGTDDFYGTIGEWYNQSCKLSQSSKGNGFYLTHINSTIEISENEYVKL